MERIEIINDALAIIGITGIPNIVDQFKIYRELLIKWNGRNNLISSRDESRIVARHFLQSVGLLAVVDIPVQSRLMDLGTGAGFPGLPLKLVRPDLHVLLVESRRKKTLFLDAIIKKLDLSGVEIFRSRVEDIDAGEVAVDVVACRAVSDLATLAKWSRPFLQERTGRLVAIKGPDIEEELDVLKSRQSHLGFRDVRVQPFNPFLEIAPFRESVIVEVDWGESPDSSKVNSD